MPSSPNAFQTAWVPPFGDDGLESGRPDDVTWREDVPLDRPEVLVDPDRCTRIRLQADIPPIAIDPGPALEAPYVYDRRSANRKRRQRWEITDARCESSRLTPCRCRHSPSGA